MHRVGSGLCSDAVDLEEDRLAGRHAGRRALGAVDAHVAVLARSVTLKQPTLTPAGVYASTRVLTGAAAPARSTSPARVVKAEVAVTPVQQRAGAPAA